jgi:hypothetical protein
MWEVLYPRVERPEGQRRWFTDEEGGGTDSSTGPSENEGATGNGGEKGEKKEVASGGKKDKKGKKGKKSKAE